jgi:hypothetical protein
MKAKKTALEQLQAKFKEALSELEFLSSGFKSSEEGLTDEEVKIVRTIIEQVKLDHLIYVP